MKKISILLLIASASLMIQTSCSKEQELTLNKEISLFASSDLAEETAESKAYISGNQSGQATKVSWNSGDKIAVFNDSNEKKEFTYNSTDNVFRGSASGTLAFAAYPYSQVESFDGTTFSAIVPSEETVKNPASFSHNGTLTFGPVTESDGSYSTKMKHICGFVKFYAPDEAVKKVTLTANEPLVGKVNVTFDGDGVPCAELVPGDSANSTSVSLDKLHGGSMYMFSILPGNYTGLKVKVEYYSKSGKPAKTFSSDKTLTVVKGQSCILGVLPVCNNIVTLDFTVENDDKQLYTGDHVYGVTTEATKTNVTYKLDWTIDGEPTTLDVTFGIGTGENTIKNTSWKFNNSAGGIQLNYVGAYIKLPSIPGKKIALLSLNESNSSGSNNRDFIISNSDVTPKQGKNVIIVQGYANTPDHTYWSAQNNNAYVESRDVYLYSNQTSSNSMIRKIVMYYTDNFDYDKNGDQ